MAKYKVVGLLIRKGEIEGKPWKAYDVYYQELEPKDEIYGTVADKITIKQKRFESYIAMYKLGSPDKVIGVTFNEIYYVEGFGGKKEAAMLL